MDVGLMFGVIFAVIFIGFLLAFGTGYITNFMNLNSEATMKQQVNSLKFSVKSASNLAQGSIEKIKLIVPSGYKKVCFVDPEYSLSNPAGNWESSEFLISMITKYKYNILIFGQDDLPEGDVIEKAKPYQNFCITSSRELILRNTGAIVEITLPEF